jgi:ketosteroid isomerase-like protein
MSTALRATSLVAIVFACVLAPLAARADTRGEIAAMLDYYAEVWNEGDLDALRGYYHEDFRLITANGVTTAEQRLADLATVAEGGADRGELTHGDVEILELGDKHALAYGRLSLRFKDGSSIDGWFSTVFVNTPFGWKALVTHN